MRLPVILLGLFLSVSAVRADVLLPGEDDLIFKTQPKHVQKYIQWIIVEDLEQACFGKPKNPGDGELRGCAKSTPKTCVIYTKRITSLANLGHEMRHCFEGYWHE
jgi:hypothetical protein